MIWLIVLGGLFVAWKRGMFGGSSGGSKFARVDGGGGSGPIILVNRPFDSDGRDDGGSAARYRGGNNKMFRPAYGPPMISPGPFGPAPAPPSGGGGTGKGGPDLG